MGGGEEIIFFWGGGGGGGCIQKFCHGGRKFGVSKKGADAQ